MNKPLNFCANCEVPLNPPLRLCEPCCEIAVSEAGDADDFHDEPVFECERCGEETENFSRICDDCLEQDFLNDINRRLEIE